MTAHAMEPIHPGEILTLEYLEPLGVTQHRVAVAIGVPPRRINEIVHGKRGITADTALRLAISILFVLTLGSLAAACGSDSDSPATPSSPRPGARNEPVQLLHRYLPEDLRGPIVLRGSCSTCIT
jgi:addiction module HigA family antidote